MSFRDEFAVHLSAPPADVYRALSEPDALEAWLAEHADVSLEDGKFEFWGRYTPDGARGHQRLLATEKDQLLRFAWTIGSLETTTEFRLEPGKDGGTRMAISYTNVPTLEELAAGAEGAILWTFWLIPASALADYVEGREPGPRFDFEAAKAAKGDEMRTTVTLDAPPDEVYPYLIEPEKLDQWIGMNSRADARVGGEIEIHEGQGAAKILELEPGRRLTVGWGERPDVTVRWELEGAEGKTYLTLVHSGFDDDNPMDIGAWGGWMHGLAQLRRVIATGSPLALELFLGDMPDMPEMPA
jgi:uncharacterized protein YndB with AHSA1/START domain